MQVKKTPKWLLLLISCLMISFFFHSTSLGAYAEEKQEYSSNGSVTLYGEYKFEEESANPKDKKNYQRHLVMGTTMLIVEQARLLYPILFHN